VITSLVRPIRRLSAIITEDQSGHVWSSGFDVLRPSKIASEVLLVFLRLLVIAELLDLHTTATMYPAIPVRDLLGIPISKPEDSVAEAIVEKVSSSRRHLSESVSLIQEATRAIDQVI
jgi:hypothetical protein